ncbi:histidine phosphatase family protein [Streptomyces sp. NBC_01465]|uniref:histidine phosphatase family protein n=1 Tax=Streptomyces sp. NBC_01465 TaxID=2903878 RepID=UPI002E340BEE|nr:histidine phosphatase family protein [Streptomyces sp. NBC_01465]
MRLILIRHGQTPTNVAYTMHTTLPGPELTHLGQQQASALVSALADEKIDALFASTHQRTQLTAAPLAEDRGLQVLIRDGIREVSAGHWEGAGDHASHNAFLDLVFGWPTDPTTRVPGGESGLEVLQRIDGVVHEAVQSGGETVVMVSHGVAIRVWLAARAANFSARDAKRRTLDNTGAVIVDRSAEGTWQVLSWAGQSVGPSGNEPWDSVTAGENLGS